MKCLSIALALFVAFGSPSLAADVKAYEETITMPTWEIGSPEVHSEFLDSGKQVYPYTYNETLTNSRVEKPYKGVILENEYIKVLVLPEIGGRLHGALDKTNNYEWLYWQKTIKPGLVGMTGAWISGGIEWNFPHGHRPSGFMPVDHRIVHHDDGSATVWVGETEPIFRMRWLVGMTVYPGRSYVRCDYVFINPTDHRNSFQFWATSTTKANESAQAQYPGHMVTGHGKHEFWNWPIHEGVDLTWWKNVPNASSFFAFNNPSPWFGAFDHKAQGGTVHVANPHIMPGKKLWTWGSGPSGRIWEDILSEGGGAYYEPQAGAWSDNQPDYHWMAPHEVKKTHDYWYPVRDTRGFHNANEDFAINTDLRDGMAFGGVYSTGVVEGYRVVLTDTRTGTKLSDEQTSISPDKPYQVEKKIAGNAKVYNLRLSVYDGKGRLAIEVQQSPPKKVSLPKGQTDPGDPRTMSEDQLYHAGEWLDRYRRTDEADAYYQEALNKDLKNSRVNVDLGFLSLKQGRWRDALQHLETAFERDSDNSKIYFGRGLAYTGLGKYDLAYKEFYRASYTYDYHSASYLNLAKLDMRRAAYSDAVEKLDEAASHNGRSAEIQAMKATAYRHLEEYEKAMKAADRALELDAMHPMAGYERLLSLRKTGGDASTWESAWQGYMRKEAQNHLELAVRYGAAGLHQDADGVLARFSGETPAETLHPMVNYFRGYFSELAGNKTEAAEFYLRASRGPVAHTNPNRLEARAALESAMKSNTSDSHAPLFLGNLLYAAGQRKEGFALWQKAVKLDATLDEAWRNVAYGERYLNKSLRASYESYEKAAQLDPGDTRVLLELDQVAEELDMPAEERLARLDRHPDTVNRRDDLLATVVDLRIARGDRESLEKAYSVLADHHFHSWEGKYGIHAAWVEVNEKLGDLAFGRKDYQAALEHYGKATEYPKNLEVAARTPDFRAHVFWNLAKVHRVMGNADVADDYLQKVIAEKYSGTHIGAYYQALAQKAKGNEDRYRSLMSELEHEARLRTSGGFDFRGGPETIGHYLKAVVLEEKGDHAGAEAASAKALKQDRRVRRLALREAQLDVADAHQ